MRRLILGAICALGVTSMAFAELQSVKITGGLSSVYTKNSNFNFNGDEDSIHDKGSFFSTSKIGFELDITDSIMANISFINERDWDQPHEDNENVLDTKINTAYLTVSNLFYSNIDVTVGRQELNVGKGLSFNDGVPNDALDMAYMGHYSNPWLLSTSAFDAVKLNTSIAGLDVQSFWVLHNDAHLDDLVDHDSDSSTPTIDNALNILGGSVTQTLDCGSVELYYIGEFGSSIDETKSLEDNSLQRNILGSHLAYSQAIGSGKASLCSEIAFAFGESQENYNDNTAKVDISSMAFNIDLGYTDCQGVYGVNFIFDYHSGDVDFTDNECSSWEASSQFYSLGVGSIIDQTYLSSGVEFDHDNDPNTDMISASSPGIVGITLSGFYKLTSATTLSSSVVLATSAKKVSEKSDIGTELNIGALYQYNEALSFNAGYSLFSAGELVDLIHGEEVGSISQCQLSASLVF